MNQMMNVKSSPRPEEEGPLPLNTPALPKGLHGKGLGVEGAEVLYQKNTTDTIRTLMPLKNRTMSSMKSLLTTWKKC